MRKKNSKLNFTKNQWASWFSCGQPKVSKWSFHSSDWVSTQKLRLHHCSYYIQFDKRNCVEKKFKILKKNWLRINWVYVHKTFDNIKKIKCSIYVLAFGHIFLKHIFTFVKSIFFVLVCFVINLFPIDVLMSYLFITRLHLQHKMWL